jgi:hypothetical protein
MGMGQAIEFIQRLGAERGAFRRRDLVRQGISHAWVDHLGWIVAKLGPRVYGLWGTAVPAQVQVCARVPSGILCLRSAMHVHGISESPPEVWIAIGRRAYQPHIADPATRFVRCSEALHPHDVQQSTVEGFRVSVYSVERTFIDCVRHRNLLGTEWVRRAWREWLLSLGSRERRHLEALARQRHAYAPVKRLLTDEERGGRSSGTEVT